MSIDNTLTERGARYGEFPDHATITQGLKNTMQASENWLKLADDQKEALEMVAHKIGRIINGDPNYIDSWTDIIGYTRLVEKRLIDEQEAMKNWMFCTNKPVGDVMSQAECSALPGREQAACDEFERKTEDLLLRVLKEVFGPDVQIRQVE